MRNDRRGSLPCIRGYMRLGQRLTWAKPSLHLVDLQERIHTRSDSSLQKLFRTGVTLPEQRSMHEIPEHKAGELLCGQPGIVDGKNFSSFLLFEILRDIARA